MRASDVAWSWVAQQVRENRVAQGGASVSSRDWEVGTNRRAGAVAARGAGDDRMGRRGQGKDQQEDAVEGVVLSRQVLKSTLRVRERPRELADSLGLTTGEVWDMELGPVEMTPRLPSEVWRNTNKLAGLVEGK